MPAYPKISVYPVATLFDEVNDETRIKTCI